MAINIDQSTKNIVDAINSMSNIKKESINFQRSIMLDKLSRERNLQDRRAEKEMDLEFEGKKAKNWWEGMGGNTQQSDMQAPMPWDKNAPVPTVENNLPAMSMVGGGVGNIDAQPVELQKPVINNPDGSVSTERTITVGLGDKYYNIPTLVNGQQVSKDEAVRLFRSGQNPSVGSFNTEEEAVRAAEERSRKKGMMLQSQQEQPVVIDGVEYPHPTQLYKNNDNKMEEWMLPYSMAYRKISQGKGTEREFNMIRNFGKELKSQPFTSLQEVNLDNIPKPTNEDERQQILASLPDDVAENVQAAGEYRLDAKAIYGLRNNSADRAKFDAIINRVYPGWNMAKYTQRQKYLGDLAAGKLNQQVVSLNTLAKHLDSLDQTVDSLKNSDLKPKNAIINMAKDLTGDSTITDYRFAREVVYGELERALTGVGVTQEAMKRLDSLMSENAGFNQLKENISLLKTIVKGRITPLRTQYKNIMGKEEDGEILFKDSNEIFNANDTEGTTSLPSEIKTTSEAVKYLTEQGMSEDEAIQWLRSQ